MEKIEGTLAVIVRSGELNRWVDEAMKSALQSDGIDLKVVLVLNGPKISLDATQIQSEEEQYPWLTDSRVLVLRFNHYLGMSGSIIEGIKHVNTEYIANLDGDDIVLPQRFAKQLEYLQSHPDCVLVGARAHMIDEDDQQIGDLKSVVSADVRKSLFLFNPIPHSSVMFRKSAYDKIGGHTPGLDQCEDYDLTLRIGTLGKVAVLPDFLVLYRVHTSNLSKGAAPRGPHVDCVTRGRRQLAKTLGVPAVLALPPHLLWRSVQFVRASGLIRPLHEYFTYFKRS
ncbi:MAG TPA: glycosyltransferase [Candidatus Rothia avistercoris]|uniref:Glycosyltransferase n=1 Tax=Candidatus Rothia avistercoris TaxID=2840479 RepID=A0A9D2UEM9_9MICC|nr:glycosyltransferase [Rothia nasimurium]HJD51030.1 glycosyltransferase [Candidatus Rothia avistercoris]